MPAVKGYHVCYSLKPLDIPESYWTVLAKKKKCPFCDKELFYNIRTETKFTMKICKTCMRVYVLQKK